MIEELRASSLGFQESSETTLKGLCGLVVFEGRTEAAVEQQKARYLCARLQKNERTSAGSFVERTCFFARICRLWAVG
jgi:hypothetical protein